MIGHFSAINPEHIEDFIDFFDSFSALFNNSTNTMLTIVYIIIAGIKANGFLMIINIDSPITENILNQMSYIYQWIYLSCFKTMSVSYIILSVIGSLIYIIGLVVNLEFIIIYLFGLEMNTKEEMSKRSIQEIEEEHSELLEY